MLSMEVNLEGMKKYIFCLLLILIVALSAYLSFGVYRNSYLSTNIENGSYYSCLNDSTIKKYSIDLWNQTEIFDIRFVASGNTHCFAPKFPSIEVSFSKVTHWLHIVETSGDVQFSGKHASLGNFGPNWVFVDVVSQEKRDSSNPFYSVGEVFRDNPGWTSAPHITLTWNGKLFGLSEIEGVFYPVGGVSWGFNLQSWSLTPEAIPPKLLHKSAWFEVVEALNDEYPNYVFSI